MSATRLPTPLRTVAGAPPGTFTEPFVPTADADAPPRLDALDVGDDVDEIEPRGWLLGNAFCREFISGLIAPGAGGKTSLRIVQFLSLATGRELTGEHVFARARVLIICLEDSKTELRRRIRAAMLHYGVTREDVKGYLFLATPMGLKMARCDPKTQIVAPAELDQAIRSFVDEKKIDLVSLDPMKKAHAVKENSNDDMDAVVTIMAQIAIEKKIAFDILSHERKSGAGGGEAGDADRARGASAVKDGGRLMYTITAMSSEEAQTFGVDDEQRPRIFRVDSAKFNLGPAQRATWFRLIGVSLGNASAAYPNGDEVQTVERWIPPQMFEGLSTEQLNAVLDKLGTGMPDGRRYSVAPSAQERAAWKVLHQAAPTKTEKQCRAVINEWHKNGVFEIGPYHDAKERRERDGIFSAKRIGVDAS